MSDTTRVLCALALVTVAGGPASAQIADLVVRNGAVWTVDGARPRAQAIASLGERIVYVGDDAGVARHIGPGTPRARSRR